MEGKGQEMYGMMEKNQCQIMRGNRQVRKRMRRETIREKNKRQDKSYCGRFSYSKRNQETEIKNI